MGSVWDVSQCGVSVGCESVWGQCGMYVNVGSVWDVSQCGVSVGCEPVWGQCGM